MSEARHPAPRVLVAAVMPAKSHAVEAAAKAVTEAIEKASVVLVRSVVVKGERQYIRQLVSNVANDNEADVVVMVGGTGIGSRDDTCEALDGLFERRIEGFGEAYRRLLEGELGPHAMLVRAVAGVYNGCVVFAMTGRVAEVVRAVETLVLPTLSESVDLAIGRRRAGEARGQ